MNEEGQADISSYLLYKIYTNSIQNLKLIYLNYRSFVIIYKQFNNISSIVNFSLFYEDIKN